MWPCTPIPAVTFTNSHWSTIPHTDWRFGQIYFTAVYQTTSWRFGDMHLSGLPLSSDNSLAKPLHGADKITEENVPAPTRTNAQLVLSSDEGHSVQDKESLENPFNEITDNESDLEPEATTDTELSSTKDIHPLAIQEPPQDSNMHQLIEECSVEVPEEQKQNMEKTMLDLVKIFHHKQFLFMHDNVD
nr:hypothetical protein [Tanacetum cinerariifolium]